MTQSAVSSGNSGTRPVGPAVLLLVLAAVFAGLGVWQVYRLAWKTRLIAAVDAAIHAPPLDPASLPNGALADWTYRRLAMTGHYRLSGTTLVTGTSTMGTGYWLLVPMTGNDGRTIYINRGFMPEGTKLDAALRTVPTGEVRVEGLLRQSEPHGTFLRSNLPQQDRWYSRDIAAIAQKRGVAVDSRLFIDSSGETPLPSGDGQPVPGLTVINFPNNHLGYALTWFTMGLMATGGAIVLLRRR